MKQKNTQSSTDLADRAAVITVGDNSAFTNMATCLAEIRKLSGVAGYILRNDTSAIVDLTPQEKIADYAIFSWQIAESSGEIAKQLNLTDMKNVVVEGKTIKVLCIDHSENRVSVFIDKTLDHDSIIKKIEQQLVA